MATSLDKRATATVSRPWHECFSWVSITAPKYWALGKCRRDHQGAEIPLAARRPSTLSQETGWHLLVLHEAWQNGRRCKGRIQTGSL